MVVNSMRKFLTVVVLCLGVAGLGAGVAAATAGADTYAGEIFNPPYIAP